MQEVIRWSRNSTQRSQTSLCLCRTDILAYLLQFQKGCDSWIAEGYSSRVRSWPKQGYLATSSCQLWNQPWKGRVNDDANCAWAIPLSIVTPGRSHHGVQCWQYRSVEGNRAAPAVAFNCSSEAELVTLNTSLHLLWESKSSPSAWSDSQTNYISLSPCPQTQDALKH